MDSFDHLEESIITPHKVRRARILRDSDSEEDNSLTTSSFEDTQEISNEIGDSFEKEETFNGHDKTSSTKANLGLSHSEEKHDSEAAWSYEDTDLHDKVEDSLEEGSFNPDNKISKIDEANFTDDKEEVVESSNDNIPLENIHYAKESLNPDKKISNGEVAASLNLSGDEKVVESNTMPLGQYATPARSYNGQNRLDMSAYRHTQDEDFEDIINSSSESENDDVFISAYEEEFTAQQLNRKTSSVVELSSSEDEIPDSQMSNGPTTATRSASPVANRGLSTINPIVVSQAKYQDQKQKIQNCESDLLRAQNAMRIIELKNLPDKGKSLLEKEKSLVRTLEQERIVLKNMRVENNFEPQGAKNKIQATWDEIQAGVGAVGPRTFGKKGFEQFKAEKNMAMETLDTIHKSLAACPTENDLETDPKGLKVPLMPHQRRALAWLLWRETQKPSGGILADDMGLGKTLTMISLVIKSLELEEKNDTDKENYRDKYPGGTLVVCPASLLNQWEDEITKRTKRGLVTVEMYHGPKRETKAKRLAKHDFVITTYSLIQNEAEKSRTVFGIKWRRIIIDEAHQIRNYKSKTSEAIFQLSGRSRWALTGTPIQNKELDMYSLLKFLRCSPFDDLKVWKHWVGDKSTGGGTRLHAVISSLMLRRTKAELMINGILKSLPERKWELVPVELNKDEMGIYHKVLIFSRTLFAQFLHQRAMKDQDAVDLQYNGAPPAMNGEYFKMRNKLLNLHRVRNVSQHEILVLLLRLRQICCHPNLIMKMLQGDEDLGNAEDEEESDEMNLLEQLNKLDLNDVEDNIAEGLSEEGCGLREASKGYLNPSNPVFREDRRSSKVKILIDMVKEKVASGDKAVIVSQWASLLRLIAIHLRNELVIFDTLDGTIPVNKRMPIVDRINDPNSDTKVLLLSLTAGGVGLNLVGANHLFLLDLHWNPQLENQAQDRIYRMGQTKPIFVYKFMAVETIEERIKMLQDRKLEIADSVLTGSKKVSSSKLTLQDLKLLFDFK